jgi:hypothetical protein
METLGPDAFTEAVVNSNSGAEDGSIDITSVNRHTGPYEYSKDGSTYQISTLFSGIGAGSKTIYVRYANGCIFSCQVSVNTTSGISDYTATSSNEICYNSDGCITIRNVIGGTSPFEYSSNGIDFQTSNVFCNLPQGTYTITVKDANGCPFGKTVDVGFTLGVTDYAANITDENCGQSYGCVSLNEIQKRTAPYKYSINNGSLVQDDSVFCGLFEGDYTVYVGDINGCFFTKDVSIGNVGFVTGFTANTTLETCGKADGTITIINEVAELLLILIH